MASIQPHDVGAHVQTPSRTAAAPSVKQSLAAVRMLFDWLVMGRVLSHNSAAAVRGPRHVVNTGRTPMLDCAEWRQLMDSISTDTARDLRDRPLISRLTYPFARISAALAMRVEDVRAHGADWELRLDEKSGKQHAMSSHHTLAGALHAYLDTAAIAEDRKGFLFRTSRGRRGGTLSMQPMALADALCMVRRRALAAGITAYLANGDSREPAHHQALRSHP